MSSRVAQKQAARVIREQLAQERRRRRRLWTSATAAAVLLIAGLVGYAVYRAQQPEQGHPVPATVTADRTGLPLGSGPVTVEIYLDYLCPACQRFEQDAADELDGYLKANRITLIYHTVAILDRVSTNAYSSRSAAGAGCAADGGKLAEYTKALYGQQPEEGGPGHTDGKLIEIGRSIGLGDSFERCVTDGRYLDWVKQVTASMADRDVTGTPTVFVNGKRLDRPSAATLTAAVDAA